jgi:hypothetical protein
LRLSVMRQNWRRFLQTSYQINRPNRDAIDFLQ